MVLYWILLPIVWLLVHLIWHIEVEGRENLRAVRDGRALVICPNHVANLDPVFIAVTVFDWRRLVILAKEELFANPLAGWFLRCMGAVSIERGKGDTSTVDHVTEACKRGRGVMIFPEGTRTKNGQLGPLKSGAFVIAAAAGADILPCRIIYNTKDGRMHLFCTMRICFGPAIPAQDLRIEDPRRKVAALRKMKGRLKTELDALLVANAFEGTALPAPEEPRPARTPRRTGGEKAAPEQNAAERAEKPSPMLTLDVDLPAGPVLETGLSAGQTPEQKEGL